MTGVCRVGGLVTSEEDWVYLGCRLGYGVVGSGVVEEGDLWPIW